MEIKRIADADSFCPWNGNELRLEHESKMFSGNEIKVKLRTVVRIESYKKAPLPTEEQGESFSKMV